MPGSGCGRSLQVRSGHAGVSASSRQHHVGITIFDTCNCGDVNDAEVSARVPEIGFATSLTGFELTNSIRPIGTRIHV